VTIYLNPTPVMDAVADTIICDNGIVDFDLSSLNGKVLGDKKYYLETSFNGGFVSGVIPMDEYDIIDFSDTLVNFSDAVQTITYTFKPRIKNPRGDNASEYCDRGIDKQVVIYLLPDLVISDSSRQYIGGWNIRCKGNSDGAIFLDVSGGYTAFPWYGQDDAEYQWSTGASSRNVTSLTDGIYTVTVTDFNGCTAYDTIVLTEPDSLISEIDVVTPISCGGGNDGALDLIITGGTKAYDVTWTSLNNYYSKEEDISNLWQDYYMVTVVDTNSCINENEMYLLGPDPITMGPDPSYYGTVNGTEMNISCYNLEDGYIHLSTTGGAYPLTYEWTGPDSLTASTRDIDNIGAGTYTIKVTDDNGCYNSRTIIMNQPDTMEINTVDYSTYYDGLYNISCDGKNDGSISMLVLGGFGKYNYTWGTVDGSGVSTHDPGQQGLTDGTYYVTIYDSVAGNHCFISDTFELTQPEPIDMDTSLSEYNGFNISCNDRNDGSITIKPTGGQGEYAYHWASDNGSGLNENEGSQSGLSAGTYNLDIIYGGEYQCITSWEIELIQPDSLQALPVLSDYNGYHVSCAESTDGFIDPNVSGGAVPYSYTWHSHDGYGLNPMDVIQEGLASGTYVLNLEDANNCTNSWEIELVAPQPLEVSVDNENITCLSDHDGYVHLDVSGGVGPYHYNWSTGDTVPNLDSLVIGYYSAVISDMNGCFVSASADVEEPDPLEINTYIMKPISCYGYNDGAVSAQVTGGREPFNFTWNTGSDEEVIDMLPAGTYAVEINDGSHCHGMDSIIIKNPTRLSLQYEVDPIECYGDSNAVVELTGIGGNGEFKFFWQTPGISSSREVEDLPAGTYPVAVIDENSCRFDTVVTVLSPAKIETDYNIVPPYCSDTDDGSLAVDISGGIPPYDIKWNDFSQFFGQNQTILSDLTEGYYLLYITDANQCAVIDTVEVKGERAHCLNIPTAFTPNGDGYNETWEITVGDEYREVKLYFVYPEANVEIYNRWGKLIYQSDKGYTREWDGKYNGLDLPIDSYHYVIDLGENKRQIVGNVTIVK